MNINDNFPSDYLRAGDLKGKKIKVEIERVEIVKVGNDTKPAIYFLGKDKGLVLNKTNSMTIAAGYGSETDDWAGRSIYLYPAKVNFQNQMVDAIRVELPMQMAAPDDSIPF